MTRLALLCALAASSLAFADEDEEALRKKDEAAARACQKAKDTVAKEAACADENEKLSSVVCSDKEQRTASDFAKLSGECLKKAKPVKKKKK